MSPVTLLNDASEPDSSASIKYWLPLTTPFLRPLVSETLAELKRSSHPWASALAWVLRTRVIYSQPLPFKIGGFTWAVLPIIVMNRASVWEGISRGPAGRAWLMQILLHEAAHQLGAVWPEWRNWFGDRSHYGPERNAADAIAEEVMRSVGLPSHYAHRQISYVSPLKRGWQTLKRSLAFTKRRFKMLRKLRLVNR